MNKLTHLNDEVQAVAVIKVLQKIMADVFVNNCKTCSLSASKIKVLGLHIENDHQYEVQCSDCITNLYFKSRVKKHKREVHYKETFVRFICNEKFRTHKELKQHIQKWC